MHEAVDLFDPVYISDATDCNVVGDCVEETTWPAVFGFERKLAVSLYEDVESSHRRGDAWSRQRAVVFFKINHVVKVVIDAATRVNLFGWQIRKDAQL